MRKSPSLGPVFARKADVQRAEHEIVNNFVSLCLCVQLIYWFLEEKLANRTFF